MNKLNLIVWGVPMYPVLWIAAAIAARCVKGTFPPVKEITAALHKAYGQHWRNEP